MDENKTALVKKIGEGNKSLSVIVAENKLTKFKRFSQSINLSMGYLLNQAIDRYLANNSTEIFSTSTGIPTTIGNNTPSVTVRDGDIEELISTTIETHLLNKSIGYLSKADIEELINTTIEAKLDKSSIGIAEVENLVNISIDNRITPLTESITKLETQSQNEFKQVREELRAVADRATTEPIANPAQNLTKPDIDDVRETDTIAPVAQSRHLSESKILTLINFSNHLGYPIPPGVARQPNVASAKPFVDFAQSLGETWIFNSKDRRFHKVDATVESALPLFPN